jgi:hypothetical protein
MSDAQVGIVIGSGGVLEERGILKEKIIIELHGRIIALILHVA